MSVNLAKGQKVGVYIRSWLPGKLRRENKEIW